MSITSYNSTLTSRYQTTIPAPVRQILELQKHDTIEYVLHSDGTVTLIKDVAQKKPDDPILMQFLDFLADDIRQNPQNIISVPSGLLEHASSLVDGVDIDLDAPLSDEDE